MNQFKSFTTQAIHAGETADPETGALRGPIHMTTTFKLPKFGSKLFDALFMEDPESPYVYTRWSNPTLRTLEVRLAALEEAEECAVFASGVGAISALVLSLLSAGDHLVSSDVCYAGALELFNLHLPRFGIEVSLVDSSDPEQIRAAVKDNTKLIYVETPANPILKLTDIKAVSQIAREAGVPLAVDSTFASPVLQKPLTLGADFVIHSLTKYINGHGDALGGMIAGSTESVHRIRKEMLVHLGSALSPFNAWLISRGINTLELRVKQQSASAEKVAQFLENHPAVERVIYPGLASHPQHDLAKEQMDGFGGMLSFQLKTGLEGAITLAENVKLFQYATSLGHAHSLLFYYPSDLYVDAVPYYGESQKVKIREWTGEGIFRTSIGLEDPDDLIEDLDQALKAKSIKAKIAPIVYELLKKYSSD
ncbi:MAG: PLP-dependent aspartate aminotransferase family protein [Anaerolineales bacterium]